MRLYGRVVLVEQELLGEGFGEGAQRDFRGGVCAVAGEGEESDEGGGEDDVVRFWCGGFLGSVWGWPCWLGEPGLACCVRDVRCGEVVGLELVFQCGLGEIEEVAWMRGARAAEDQGGRLGVIPCRGFAEDPRCFGG